MIPNNNNNTQKNLVFVLPSLYIGTHYRLLICACVCACVQKVLLFHFFQHTISPGYHEPLLPNTHQVQCVLSTTQAWATRACAMASVCPSKPYVSTWISPEYCYIYNGLYVLMLTAILNRPYMGMLRHISEKATDTVPPSGQPLWPLGVVTWWVKWVWILCNNINLMPKARGIAL